MQRICVTAVIALAAAGIGNAQQPQGPPPCQAPEYRQFDFWIGNWNVFNVQGQQIGTNTITRVNDCYLHESWISSRQNRGNSYNIFDSTRRKWHQTWVDNGGTLLTIEGGLRNGSMVLEGETTDPQGVVTLNRITWTPFTTDSVQQLWESSNDGGTTWTTGFDGRYVRQ